MSVKKVPVTILSGQLGSGKSTLLRRILQNQSNFKFAVIMNEFAQTADIEGKTIQLTVANEGTEFQEWLELDNGCLCCSAQDHGVRAIESLMQRCGSFEIELITDIELGVADPSQIATLFWLDSALESVLYLDGILITVDSLNLEMQLDEEARDGSGTVTQQIAVADSIYISKLDLVDDEKLSRVKQMVKSINPGARLNDSSQTLTSTISELLNLDAFSSFNNHQKVEKVPSRFCTEEFKEGVVVGHQGIGTLTIHLPILDTINDPNSKFDKVFRKLIWEGVIGEEEMESKELRILRAKGLLKDQDGKWYILQAVRDLYEVQEITVNEEDHGIPRLILIGKDLDVGLKESFLTQIS
ncbi:CobW/HypB/UreG, nucleotide-binding domain-containing protein [Melampsora americana]|nr:CobW/HypB/UreG, nucleotide-binding domain-containing protein [Melampsora americana]